MKGLIQNICTAGPLPLAILAIIFGICSPSLGAALPTVNKPPAILENDPSFRNLDEIELGRLVISGLPQGAVQFKEIRIEDNSIWNGISVNADSGLVRIFSDRTRNHLVLSGTVKHLKLNAQLTIAPFATHTEMTVAPNGLDLELDNVRGGVATTVGKELQVTDSQLTIDNDKELKISERQFSGDIKLHVSKPSWTGVKLLLADGSQAASLQFASLRSEGDVEALWSLDTGETKIVNGEFAFRAINSKGDVLLGGERATATILHADSGKVRFVHERASTFLNKLSLNGVTTAGGNFFGLTTQTDGALTADSISFSQRNQDQSLVALNSDVKGLKANLLSIVIATPSLQASKGIVVFDLLSSTEMNGVLSLEDVSCNSSPLQGTHFSNMKISFSGPLTHLKIAGDGTLTTAALGGLRISELSHGSATFSKNDDGDFSLSLSINGPGDLVLGATDANGFSGQLVSLNAKGILRVGHTSQFAIPKENLTISVSNASTNLEVLGQPLQLPSSTISLSNDSAIVIGNGQEEVLKSNLPAVQLQRILIQADDGARDAPISVPIPSGDRDNFSLGWDISTGAATLSGSVTIPGFNITVPDPPKYLWIRTQDFDVQLASLSVQSFTISFVGPAVQISINGLSITGNQFIGRKPDYSGVLSQPVTVQTIKGTIPLKTPIALKSLEVDEARVAIANGLFESSTLNVSQATLQAHLVSASSASAVGDVSARTGIIQVSSELGGGTATVAALNFSFERSGDTLNGSGRIDVGPLKFDISADTPMGPGKCNGNNLKFHVDGAAIGATADISVEANGLFGPFVIKPNISHATTSYYRCDYSEHIILAHAQKAHYTYPCPTWSEPLRTCDGWTYISPEISFNVGMVFEIQPLVGFATTAELHGEFNNGKAVGCWFRPINVTTSPGLIVWGPNAPGVPGAALRIAEGIVESTIANSLVYSAEGFVDLMLGVPVPLKRCVSSPIHF